MTKKVSEEKDDTVNLLTKLLVFQLFAMGVPQDRIARTVGKQKAWVNDLLKGIPKGGRNDGCKKKS